MANPAIAVQKPADTQPNRMANSVTMAISSGCAALIGADTAAMRLVARYVCGENEADENQSTELSCGMPIVLVDQVGRRRWTPRIGARCADRHDSVAALLVHGSGAIVARLMGVPGPGRLPRDARNRWDAKPAASPRTPGHGASRQLRARCRTAGMSVAGLRGRYDCGTTRIQR